MLYEKGKKFKSRKEGLHKICFSDISFFDEDVCLWEYCALRIRFSETGVFLSLKPHSVFPLQDGVRFSFFKFPSSRLQRYSHHIWEMNCSVNAEGIDQKQFNKLWCQHIRRCDIIENNHQLEECDGSESSCG